jgi:hypothetical protein
MLIVLRSFNFLQATVSIYLEWVEHVARMERREIGVEFWCRNHNERDRLEDRDLGGGILLKCDTYEMIRCG